MLFMKVVYILFFVFSSASFADVISTTGQIKFDTQSDNQAEMTLNATGLGIGISPSTNLHVNGNAVVSNRLFVGGSSGSSNLNVNGTLGYGFQTVSANTTLGDVSIILVDSSSDNITLTLPYAGNVAGREYQIKKISTLNSVWISGGGNLIDDTTPIELPPSNDLASVKLMSDGTQWYKIDQKDINETLASDNLVVWLKFDEASGIVASDDSGLNNDGTIINGATFSVNGINARQNRGLVFDAVNDYVQVSDDDSLDILYDFSISVWFKTSTGSEKYLATKVNNSFYLAIGIVTNKLGFWINNSSANWMSGATDVNDNQWHHVVAMRRNGEKIIYLDGNIDASTTASGANAVGTDVLRIGFRTGATQYFQGTMDDFRIYNKGLTDAEVKALYNQGM